MSEQEEYYISRVTMRRSGVGTTSYYLLIPKELVNKYNIKKGEVFMIIPKSKDEWIVKRIKP